MRGRLVFLLLFAVVALLLLANARPGPDFRRYVDWANAFQSSDIVSISGDVLSPMRVPLSQWSFGPGMIVSTVPALMERPPEFRFLLIGWVGILVFWIAMHRILDRVTGGDRALTLFGLAICFVGTPVGFYSTAISSEALSYPCLALVVLAVIETRRWRPLEALVLAVPAALLITLRSQLGLYLFAPLAVAAISIVRDRAPMSRRVASLAALATPLVIAVVEIMVTNRWMTGSLFSSPYTFGDGVFKSVDLVRPEIAAVLVHPWHGLLVYHPLYAVFLVIPLWMAVENRPVGEKALLLASAGAALIHLYLHASWYVWWLGLGTFGMRGMGISAVLLVPILCKYMAERRGRWSTRIVVAVVVMASAWSALLLLQGTTQFYTYEQLWRAQANRGKDVLTDVPLVAAVLGAVALGHWLHRSADAAARRVARTAYGLGAVALFYLGGAWTGLVPRLVERLPSGGLVLLGLSAAGALLAWLTSRWQDDAKGARLRMTIGSAFGAVFVISTALFAQLAARTETVISERSIGLDRFRFMTVVHVKEVEDSYVEYLRVDGFNREKDALRRFVAATKEAGVSNLERERAQRR